MAGAAPPARHAPTTRTSLESWLERGGSRHERTTVDDTPDHVAMHDTRRTGTASAPS